MAGGGGGLAGVSRGSGERREAGSADEPRTEPELERAAGGGRAGGRERGAPGPGPGPGAGAGALRGVCARRGLRRSPSARRCGDVRQRRDRAASRARQSRPYTDTKCLRGKLQARDAGGGRRGGDRQTDGDGWFFPPFKAWLKSHLLQEGFQEGSQVEQMPLSNCKCPSLANSPGQPRPQEPEGSGTSAQLSHPHFIFLEVKFEGWTGP
nr:uncharacterized protein LOC132597954 [Globicephala melas]